MSNVVPILGNQDQGSGKDSMEKKTNMTISMERSNVNVAPSSFYPHTTLNNHEFYENRNDHGGTDNNDIISKLKNKSRNLLYNPISSKSGHYFSIFLASMIILSSVMVIIETLPRFYMQRNSIIFFLETMIIILFTLEFLLRCFANSDSRRQFIRFLFSIQTLVDLLAILPYYVEVLFFRENQREFQSFTVFRLFRLLRLFRCFRTSATLQLPLDAMMIAIEHSADALMAIVIFLSFTVVMFSTLIYFAERGIFDPNKGMFIDSDGMPSKFNSIPATFWFVLQIITTIGLGDVVPKTFVGKVISFPLILLGVLIIALPSIVIGKNFAEVTIMLRAERNYQQTGMVSSATQANNNVQILIEMIHQLKQQNSLLMDLMEKQQSNLNSNNNDIVHENHYNHAEQNQYHHHNSEYDHQNNAIYANNANN